MADLENTALQLEHEHKYKTLYAKTVMQKVNFPCWIQPLLYQVSDLH